MREELYAMKSKRTEKKHESKTEDKIIREALEIAKRFKVLPYHQINALLETKLGNVTVERQ